MSAALGLHRAAMGDWEGAGTVLRISEGDKAVVWDAFERDLYGRLGRALALREVERPAWIEELAAEVGDGPGFLWSKHGPEMIQE